MFVVVLALSTFALASACSDDDTSTSDTTSTTAETTSSTELPTTPLRAALDQPYGSGEPAVSPGAVTVAWYQADGMYVAVYAGDGIADLGPLCPGNSLRVGDGNSFDFATNAPTGPGGCDGIDSTITEVQVCDEAWLFETRIPVASSGQLFASISSSGTTAGVLGFVATGPTAPEIDLEAPPVAGC
jgi:hypothetical protein